MSLSHTLYWLLQVDNVCKTLAGFPELEHGYNAIGFSQGRPLLTRSVSWDLPPAFSASRLTLVTAMIASR